jgi:hypothetical protein
MYRQQWEEVDINTTRSVECQEKGRKKEPEMLF